MSIRKLCYYKKKDPIFFMDTAHAFVFYLFLVNDIMVAAVVYITFKN